MTKNEIKNNYAFLSFLNITPVHYRPQKEYL